MKFTKVTFSNLAFVFVLVLFLFTPIGFHTKVFISKLFSFSPSVIEEDEQLLLADYHWQLSALHKESLDFKDLEGKVVIVNFWATWCPPCVAEMSSFQKLYNDYGDKVAFVFVANDDTEKVKLFLREKGYSLPVYFEKSSTPNEMVTSSIPATFVIDKKGNIIVKKIGAADWNSKTTRELIDTVLKE